jgi:anti-anti-sigma factor
MSDLLPCGQPDGSEVNGATPAGPRREPVRLRGEFDIATAADLRHALTDDTDAPVVVADFADVTFVDSSALRALLEVRQQLAADGRTLELINLSDQVAALLRITDTDQLFVIRSSPLPGGERPD